MRFRSSFLICAFTFPFIACGAAFAQEDYVDGEVLVIFKPGFGEDAANIALGRHSLKLDRQFQKISAQRGRVAGLVKDKALGTAKLIEQLKSDPSVETVEPNYLRHLCVTTPNDPDFAKLWALQNMGQTVDGLAGTSGVDTNFIPAWRMARPAPPEVVVGVVDTGVDIGHPDLAANIWTNPGEIPGNGIDDDGNGYVDDVHGFDFGQNTANITDSDSHGTHVAGTIGAIGKNASGVIGVEYRAKILPLEIADQNGNLPTAAMLAAYDYVIGLKQHGVNIVALNASFGGAPSSTSERLAIEALRDNQIILCAAAGNGGTDQVGDNNDSIPFYPASYTTSNIISVAALTQTNTLASFSNYGATSVDIAAPGVNIYSTMPRDFITPQCSVSKGATGYASQEIRYSGTTPLSGISGTIHNCGLGNPGDFPPAVLGNIALIQRGTLTFGAKVANARNAGAVAAIIYDNTTSALGSGWTLGNSDLTIPAVQVTQASGTAILSGLPASGKVVNYRDNTLIYQFLDGTSMAAPHVAGAVAFAALNFPSETMSQRIARVIGNVTPVTSFAGKMVSGGRLNLLKMIDTDNDGMPDWWELENFGNLAQSAAGDADADGFSNLDEFLAATDPKNPASHLSFSAFATLDAGQQTHFTLSFPSVAEQLYRIEWSGSLVTGSWQPLGAPVLGTGSVIQVLDTDAIHTASRRFYRMSLLSQ